MKTILATAILTLLTTFAQAQGTIQFRNDTLSRIRCDAGPGQPLVNCPAGSMVFGVFWGTSPDRLQLALPLANMVTDGIFNGGTIYPIEGTVPGQKVFMMIAGWDAAVGADYCRAINFGATDVREVTLAATEGPGTVIFQTASGTDPNKFNPFVIGGLVRPPPCVPEPSILGLSGVAGLLALSLRRRTF